MTLPPFPIDDMLPEGVIAFRSRKPKTESEDPRPAENAITERPTMPWDLVGAKCRHINIQVCEDMAEVECRDCGAKLNPIWVLARMAKQETKWAFKLQQYNKAREEHEKRVRCKCQHCGKMTRI